MKKELTIGLLTVALTIGLASTVTAQTLEQQSDVDVEVSGVTQLDVRPSSLAYTGSGQGDALEPGESRTVSDNGYEHIEVENIGSERIGTIYAQATMPTEQPFGTLTQDTSTDPVHNTGNFVTMSLDTAQSYSLSGLSEIDEMHHLNRVEYFEDNYPTYISVDNVDDDYNSTGTNYQVEDVSVGRFRVGGADYFFAVYEGSSDASLRVGNTPHTSTQLGTTDLSSDGSDYTSYDDLGTLQAGDAYRVDNQEFVSFDTSASGDYDGSALVSDGSADFSSANISESDSDVDVRNYNLWVDPTNGYIVRTKFNVEQQSPDNGADWNSSSQTTGAQEYIFDAGGTVGNALQPGQNFPIDFGVQVHLGTDQNAIEEGTVTVISDTYN